MTYVAIFTVFQFFSPHLFNAKTFLVDVKENGLEDADETNDMVSTENKDYASSAKFCFSAKRPGSSTPGLGGTIKNGNNAKKLQMSQSSRWMYSLQTTNHMESEQE